MLLSSNLMSAGGVELVRHAENPEHDDPPNISRKPTYATRPILAKKNLALARANRRFSRAGLKSGAHHQDYPSAR